MKKTVSILCIVFFLTNVLGAATVSLSGTVKDNAGKGIEGAKVSLAINKGSATTDAQGAFTLTKTKIVQLQSSIKPEFQFSLAGNMLVISPAFENTNGRVAIYSSDGRKNASILFSGNSAGKQAVNLPEFVSGLNIIRVTIGNDAVTRTLVCMGNSNRYLKNDAFAAKASWRFMATQTGTEDLNEAQGTGWYSSRLKQFNNSNAGKLPIDQHELVAMVAPRAVLAVANTGIDRLGSQAGYASMKAASEVWKALGIPDRIGWTQAQASNHCAFPSSQTNDVASFVDRFILGKTGENVQKSPYNPDMKKWITWDTPTLK